MAIFELCVMTSSSIGVASLLRLWLLCLWLILVSIEKKSEQTIGWEAFWDYNLDINILFYDLIVVFASRFLHQPSWVSNLQGTHYPIE